MSRRRPFHPIPVFGLALLTTIGGCGGGLSPTGTVAQTPPTADVAALRLRAGETLFHDNVLSASGAQNCGSCHVEDHASADGDGVFLPLGGVDMAQQGMRSTPPLHYIETVPRFTIDADGQPHGGFFWDGRASTLEEQSTGPLFGAAELANADSAALAARIRASAGAPDLAKAFSLGADAGDGAWITALQQAFAAYEIDDDDFHPFSAKWDAVLAGKAQFTPAEARGLAAFADPQRGNCASCHSLAPLESSNGHAMFTDFSYHALGVPRNASTHTANAAFYDLGLCGPSRTDLSGHPEYCGRFRVPSLRNVALTAPYFHNGVFTTLEQVVGFYATRDTDPGRWYPTVGGKIQVFDDLPPAYFGNLQQGAPFNLPDHTGVLLGPQDVSDIIAFLHTLSDGYFTP